MKLLSLAILLSTASALLPLNIKGKRFIKPHENYKESGDVFFIKGIDYQPGGSSGYDSSSGEDALTNVEQCYRDAYAFQQLNINTLRIYTLNPDLNHDECVTIMNNAGIYLLLDVNSGDWGESLNRADPGSSYNAYYLTRVFKFIEAFKDYPNVLGFFSGNEVINDQSDYAYITPRYVRAVQRDMKEYIAKHSNRSIPVGYSAADSIELRRATYEYLQCYIDGDEDDNSRSDFFGLNSYEWCSGISDWSSSGYQVMNDTMSNTSIPLLFSEFGCNTDSPRTFDEISEGLFDGLVNTFSGGLVYEYSQEASNYGVVDIDSDGDLTYLKDFANLKHQYAIATIPNISESDVPDGEVYECDAELILEIYPDFGANFTLPEQPDSIKELIENGVNATNFGKLLDNVEPKGSNYTIYNTNTDVVANATVTFDKSNEINSQTNVPVSSGATSSSATSASTTEESSTKSSSSKHKGAAGVATPFSLGVALSLLFNLV